MKIKLRDLTKDPKDLGFYVPETDEEIHKFMTAVMTAFSAVIFIMMPLASGIMIIRDVFLPIPHPIFALNNVLWFAGITLAFAIPYALIIWLFSDKVGNLCYNFGYLLAKDDKKKKKGDDKP